MRRGGVPWEKSLLLIFTNFFIESDSVFDADHEYRIAIEFRQKLKKLLTKQFSYTPPDTTEMRRGGIRNFS